jgi:hypothetical protein
MIWLKAVTDYAVDPAERVWAALGTGTHGKLSMYRYTDNVLSEEPLSDSDMSGIPDVLEQDEQNPGSYILYDYKTWGSYKLAKALGIVMEKIDVPVLDDSGKPVLLKSGENKGKPKTAQKRELKIVPATIDRRAEELQLNRYRIFFEKHGFPISKMLIQAIPRDGGTYAAEGRGITEKLYLIPATHWSDTIVLEYYKNLSAAVAAALAGTTIPPKCNTWESWEGRRCRLCEVKGACDLSEAV